MYRPAAIEQLATLAGQVGVDFFPSATGEAPVAIATGAVDWARRHYHDVVIVDTAGRLAIDDAMMREIAELHAAVKPVETLFVVDAMQGQDAVDTRAFRDTCRSPGDLTSSTATLVEALRCRCGKSRGADQVRREKIDRLETFIPADGACGSAAYELTLIEEAHRNVDRGSRKLAKEIEVGRGFDLE